MRSTSNWLQMWARLRPGAEALVDVGTGRRWTYAQLHAESLCWAGRLRAEGVGPGDRVAVLAQNRGETFALLFAVAELGAMLLPLNWRLSPPELRYQIDDAGIRLLLTDQSQAGVLPEVRALPLEEGPGAFPYEGGPGSALEQPWVLMYTSGSTGRPKAAMLTHQQLHWNALNTTLACDLGPGSSTLTFTPLFHTGGLNCLSSPLLHRGGKVVLCPRLEAGEALALIAGERITHLMGVPTIYQMLADHPNFDRADLSSVRDALCGGAALPLPLFLRYRERGIPLRQGFGLTEVGPNCFSMPAERALDKMTGEGDPTAGPPGSCVGLPIHHVAARLVRPDGADCAPGEPGELILGGPALCGGYWGLPEATAAAIRGGWFHTGDMLSRDAEGYFYVRGRIKEMYKSGGENVYPAEVEACICQHPAVAQVAVVGVPDLRWGEVGRAWLELRPGAALSAEELGAWLQGRLARFKMPRQIEILDQLPRTGSGKIDRALLRQR